jgi:glycosyltransferase involved in cell wall biosynthesis
VIATKFGPQEELHRNGRGYFIPVKEKLVAVNHAWTYFALPDYQELGRQLYHVYLQPEEAAGVAEKAYNWVQQFSWQNQAAQLDSIIEKLIGEQVV